MGTSPRSTAEGVWSKWLEFQRTGAVAMDRTPIGDDLTLKLVDGIHRGFAIETGDGHTEPVLSMIWSMSTDRREYIVFRTAGSYIALEVPRAEGVGS